MSRPGFRRVPIFALLLVVVAAAVAGAQQQALGPPSDPAAVERGRLLLVEQCGFCHGANARGGSGGPDLTRSVMVQEDENGKQLGEFLRVGRPDRGMPKFDVSDAQAVDLAAFLHSAIYLNANRRLYKILDIVVGDPKAGESFFNGAGKCNTCHLPTRDLKGIGAKYDPVTLQGKLVLPRRGGVPGSPAYQDPNALKATVSLPTGGSVTGALVRMTDFEITIYDGATGHMRSWLRNGDSPKVVVTDPLQAHVDMLTKWTDTDMHNMTAYLLGLK
jgi:mono/diheme cytochrome c family protein